MTTAKASRKKKRHYEKDPRKKLKAGEDWRLTVVLDKDNATNILNEIDESGVGGEYYQGVINKRIRDSYSRDEH